MYAILNKASNDYLTNGHGLMFLFDTKAEAWSVIDAYDYYGTGLSVTEVDFEPPEPAETEIIPETFFSRVKNFLQTALGGYQVA